MAAMMASTVLAAEPFDSLNQAYDECGDMRCRFEIYTSFIASQEYVDVCRGDGPTDNIVCHETPFYWRETALAAFLEADFDGQMEIVESGFAATAENARLAGFSPSEDQETQALALWFLLKAMACKEADAPCLSDVAPQLERARQIDAFSGYWVEHAFGEGSEGRINHLVFSLIEEARIPGAIQ